MKYTKTFGVMPTREEYDAAWEEMYARDDGGLRGNLFRFGNDPRLGTCALTQDELWDELAKAFEEYDRIITEEDSEELGGWLSSVLSCLGIEWI